MKPVSLLILASLYFLVTQGQWSPLKYRKVQSVRDEEATFIKDEHKIKINRTDVDAFINQIIKCKDMIGVTLAIVQLDDDNDIVDHYAQGYGTMNPIDDYGMVDKQSKFCIGSTTKAFTAGVVGKVLEEHGYDVHTDLVRILGDDGVFFGDSDLSALPTVRDLLSHRMSIPRYDNSWILGIDRDRRNTWEHLHELGDKKLDHLSEKFRSSFEYNNYMVSLAGYIVEELTNKTWETVVEENYFKPLHMENASFLALLDFDEYAYPAYRVEDGKGNTRYKEIDPNWMRGTIRTVAPAGGICLSAEDMEKYLTFLVHTNVSRELTALKRSIDTSWSLGSNIWDDMEVASKSSPDYAFDYVADEYALCWVRGVYKKYQFVNHGGNVYGYNSYISVFPKLKLGIMVSSTQGLGDASYASDITYGLFDMVVQDTTQDITADKICTNTSNPTPQPDPESLKPFRSCNETANRTHHEKLTGIYQHDVFGDISIFFTESDEYKFRIKAGIFGDGILCQEGGDESLATLFRIYWDPKGPFWFYNEEEASLISQSWIHFKRDKAEIAPYMEFPFIEPNAPTVQSQTYYKRDYKPCTGESTCMNGGICTPNGTYNFDCKCPEGIKGDLCEIGPRRDCSDLMKYYSKESKMSGMYKIELSNKEVIDVYCDMETDGGGWTLIQRRSGYQNFDLTWKEYENIIGNPEPEKDYWMGLLNISALADSSEDGYTLRIDLQDCQQNKAYEQYDDFWLDDTKDYTLHVKTGSAKGTAGDALTVQNSYTVHNNQPFSTYDHDSTKDKCATTYKSGWWFNDCYSANLNGKYDNDCSSVNGGGIVYLPWRSSKVSMLYARMMIRRSADV